MIAVRRSPPGRRHRWSLAALALLPALLPSALAQEIHFDTSTPPAAARPGHVSLQSDSFTIDSGKPAWIELRFHVDPGFHINSHTPGDETLIPTGFVAERTESSRLLRTEFPAGIPFHLPLGTGQTLSTYSGDFNIRLEISVPARGDSTLDGKLHYQACDNASCFPPRDLPVHLAIHAR